MRKQWAAALLALTLGLAFVVALRAADRNPSLAEFLASQGYSEIQLSVNTLGQFEVAGTVNKTTKVLLIVDTGSGRTVFDKAAFERLGLNLRSTGVQAAGIGGEQKVLSVSLDNLTIGNADTGPGTAFVIDLSNLQKNLEAAGSRTIEGIIGVDFLSRYSAVIDVKRSKLYLHLQ